jgi:uncharacterized protein GlcG (DUF336 family)
MDLDLPLARAVVAAAQASATDRDVPSAVAVLDRGGNLLAFEAHPGAILAARELAIAKAYTSVSLDADSDALGAAVQPGGPFFGLAEGMSRPIVTFAGGRPLRDPATQVVIGAVGVSGGTLDDDSVISQAAVDGFDQHLAGGRP